MNPQETTMECLYLFQGGFSHLATRVDAIFIWGRAADDWQGSAREQGVLELAAQLNEEHNVPLIIPGYVGAEVGQGSNGYPGPPIWKPALVDLGVRPDDIIPTTGGGTNTKTEFEDCLTVVQERQWRVVAVVVDPVHVLRAMLGVVSSVTTAGANQMRVFPVMPRTFDWGKKCFGSQGEGPYSRITWLRQEFIRISKYRSKGDLASAEALLKYLIRLHTNE